MHSSERYSPKAAYHGRWIYHRRYKFKKSWKNYHYCNQLDGCIRVQKKCKTKENLCMINRTVDESGLICNARISVPKHYCGSVDWNLRWKGRVTAESSSNHNNRWFEYGVNGNVHKTFWWRPFIAAVEKFNSSFACGVIMFESIISTGSKAFVLNWAILRWLFTLTVIFAKSKACALGWIRNVKSASQRVVLITLASIVPIFSICVCLHLDSCFSRIPTRQCCIHAHWTRRSTVQGKSNGAWKGGVGISLHSFTVGLSRKVVLLTKNTHSTFIRNWKLWALLVYILSMPIGEALNPGPWWFHEQPQTTDFLWIGNANPTQLLNKECCLDEWGTGVWTFSETSATEKAIKVIRSRVMQKGFNIQFGAPVPQQQKNSIMRGKAGGVAVASDLPIKSYSYPMPDFLHKSSRFMDCVIQVGNNQNIYISTIYGVAGQTSAHHHSLTIDIVNQATERALAYKGPAVICGDLNVPLESLDSWEVLQRQGWFDAAYIDSIRFQRDLQPTSKHGNRHSFILMNKYLAPSFYSCRTAAHYDFDSHPLLVAGFSIKTLKESRLTWVLPKSFDDFLFDEKELEKSTGEVIAKRSHLFRAAVETSNMDEAAKQFTLATEEIFKKSAVNSVGERVNIPPGYFGRSQATPYRYRQHQVPIVKKARNGDFIPLISQVTSSLRLHTKQLRRISALVCQLKSWENTGNHHAYLQCQQLWERILAAHGFKGGFSIWIVTHVAECVPLQVPSSHFVSNIEDAFRRKHNEQLQTHYMANHAIARIDRDKDIQMGGSKCFRDVKDLPIAPLDSIHWLEKCEVKNVTWSKGGKTKIPVKEKPNFDICEKIDFQGQKRNIVKCTDTHVILDEPVNLKQGGVAFLEQQRVSANPEDMHCQLEKFWGNLWQRDSSSDNQQEWDQAESFITCLADCPSCNYRDITSKVWHENLHGVKVKSARGADGFSTNDFKHIRYQLLDWLFEIIKMIEHNHPWPKQWSISKVTVLSKGSKPKSPLDIRPITISPKVYRLWSRLRSLEVLQHLKNQMPAQVAATAGKVSADQIAAYSSYVIEQAAHNNKEVCGLIIDLIKCYNTVPWHPCQLLFQHLGIPKEYAKPFFQFMKHLERSFQINEHCGKPIKCTTGIPEGCAMSVAIMAALSWWCYAVLRSLHPSTNTICYADNWGILTETADELFGGTTTVFRFVEALKMQVSIPKSWFWGSSKSVRKALKGAPENLKDIPIVHHAVDLGCDQNYTNRKYTTKMQQRVQKAKRVLKRIAKKPLPKRFRPTITQSAGFGAMCYGVELAKVSDTTWHHMRSAIVGALDRGKAGANPYLSCLFTKAPADPQLKAIVRTLFFWRRFFRIFQDSKQGFCRSMLLNKGIGPAVNLAKSLSAIGWIPDQNGIIRRENGAWLDWVKCSNTFLKKTLRLFWGQHVAMKIQHRKDFDVEGIDEYNMNINLNRFPEKQKSALIAHVTGAAYTNDIIAKYSVNGDATCKFCGMGDSRKHRIFECPKFQDLRNNFRNVLNWVAQQPIALQYLAVIPEHVGVLPTLLQHVLPWPDNVCPHACDTSIPVFCDGSAFWQDQPSCTIAGAAAIIVNEDGSLCRVVAAEPLPGLDHNSYRAEAFGILLTLQHIYNPTIYSDCQSAVDHLHELIICHNLDRTPIFKDHQDIWLQIWDQVRSRCKGCIKVIKTKAHENPEKIIDPQLRWEAYANNCVDQVAKSVAQNWQPVFTDASNAYALIQHDIAMHKRLCEFLVKQNEIVEEFRTPSSETTSVQTDFRGLIPADENCSLFVIQDPIVHCYFGNEFLRRVVAWARTLKWPNCPVGQISMLELYVDFTVFSNSLTPVPLEKGKDKKVKKYGLCDVDPNAKIIVHNLAQQNVIWTRFHKWARQNNIKFWDAQYLMQASCLGHVGYSLRSPALSSRPILSNHDRASKILANLLRSDSGNRRKLDIAYNGPP